MKRTVDPATLFDPPQAALAARLVRFAREVAKRHYGRPADTGALVSALAAYHRTWALFEAVPALDPAVVGIAVAEYHRARGTSRRAAAA